MIVFVDKLATDTHSRKDSPPLTLLFEEDSLVSDLKNLIRRS